MAICGNFESSCEAGRLACERFEFAPMGEKNEHHKGTEFVKNGEGFSRSEF